MAVKELLTRIALKYDSYTAWTTAPGKDLKLLKGEIGICEIPTANNDSNVAPTVLFKVGDGQKTFEQLPWASAKAADVYGWAKSETVVLDGTTIKFKTGNTVNHTIDLGAFATDAEVKAITDPIAADVADIKASLSGSAEGGIGKAVDAIEGRLDVIEGTGDGSIKKAVSTAVTEVKAYADTAESDAVATAKSYTDAEVKKVADDLAEDKSALAAHKSAANPHNITKTTIGLENVENKSVATIKSELTGSVAANNTGFVTGGAVHTAVENAKTAAANTAQGKVDALANGAVKTNTADIADLKTTTGNHTTTINTLVGTDTNKSVRAIAAEETAKIVDGANEKYDTLKEIADFIMNDKTGAAKMANDISANAQAITSLQDIVKDGGTLEVRVDQAESDIADLDSRADALEGRADAIEAAIGDMEELGSSDLVSAVIAASGNADVVHGELQEHITNDFTPLKNAVNNETTGLAATKKIADDAASGLAALTTRVGTAEGNITTIQSIVSTGANANSTLRADIKTIQDLVNDSSKGNEKLRSELTTLQGIVNNTTTGLAATKSIADEALTKAKDAQSRVSAIESDYLKAADGYIFNCGTSATVVHEVQ